MADFEALATAWFSTFAPKDQSEHNLVEQVIAADWLLQRSIRTLAEVEAQIFAAASNPLQWTDHHHKTLTRFQRYRTANQNAFDKARKAIQGLQKHKSGEHIKQERLVIAQSRLQIHQQKNKPEPTWSEAMTIMRQKALQLRK